MPVLKLSGRGEKTLFLAGANLMLINFIMVQHAILGFQNAEVAVLLFSLAYFAGVSAGYILSDRLSKSGIQCLMPVFMVVQMAMLVLLQCGHYQIERVVGGLAEFHGFSWNFGRFAAAAVVFLLTSAFVTSLYAVFLPRVIETEGQSLRRCYSVEVVGSICGLILVPLLAAVSHEALLGGYFVSFLALSAAVGVRTRAVAAMTVLVCVFLLRFGGWDRRAAAWYYANRYEWQVEEIPVTRYTPYHKIEVLKAGDGHKLILNGKRQFAGDPSRTYAYFVAEYPARLLGKPAVALLGCGSMATVGRIGDFVPSVQIVDIDREVFQAARQHFQAFNRLDEFTNWTFTADDAKHWLGNSEGLFDLILHDIPPARSRQVALTYTEEFFRLVKARLRSGGLFSISSLTPFSPDSRYGKRMVATLAHVFDRYFIVLNGGSVYFYGGGPQSAAFDPARLAAGVEPSRSSGVRFLMKPEIDELVRGETVITTSNVGDLIYD